MTKYLAIIFFFIVVQSQAQISYPPVTDSHIINLISQYGSKLPFAIVTSNGVVSYNGTNYTNSASTTCGIQEAINLLPLPSSPQTPGGGTIFFGPGVFYTTETIVTPYISNMTFSLNFVGCGMTACGITYVGTQTNDVIRIGYPYTRQATIFNACDMWFASALNGLTNVMYLKGYQSLANSDAGGGIAEAYIRNCWFGYWLTMTNRHMSPSLNPSNQKQNLVLLNIECNSDNIIGVENCTFQCGAVGVSWALDHGKLKNNTFQNCGPDDTNPTNDWPTASYFAQGPSIIFRQPQDGLNTQNGNQSWDIGHNNFINCKLHYYSLFYTDEFGNIGYGPGKYISRNSVSIVGDNDENGVVLAVTSGNPITIQDHKNGSNTPWIPIPSYQMTNATQFAVANCIVARSNVVITTSSVFNTNSGYYGFGGYVKANGGFLVTSNSWTNVVNVPLTYGDNLYVSSNGIPYVITVGPTGTRSTNIVQ